MKTDPLARIPLRHPPRPIMSGDLRDNVPVGSDDAELLQALRENVLAGVRRREQLPSEVPAPIRDPRLINLTIRVDDLTLNYARGRAVVEGTSIAALVNRLLEEYQASRARRVSRSVARSRCFASDACNRRRIRRLVPTVVTQRL